MKRSNNRGVSLIEILIAVVIFALCVTPIIAQLASSIRIGQRADDQQAATDYGRSIAETLKQTDFDMLFNTTTGREQFATTLQMSDPSAMTVNTVYSTIKADGSAGITTVDGVNPSTGVLFDSTTERYQYLNEQNKSRTAEQQEALVRKVTINGTANIDYRDYDVKIEMDTTPYALASLDTSNSYVDPNAVNLGNLSSLDAATTAVIPSVSNYDSVFAAADFNNVVSALESSPNELARSQAVQIKNGKRQVNSIARQSATTKVILVTVTKLPVADANHNNYKVTCAITYTSPEYTFNADDGSTINVAGSALDTTYVAYEQYFKDIPEVYLLYNQFLYYSAYGNDRIQIDNQSNKKAKVYVVRTAETDAEVTDSADGSGNNLLPTANEGRDHKRDGVHYDTMTNFELIQTDTAHHPVAIYTNIPLVQGAGSASNISSSIDAPGDSSCKMSVNVPGSEIGDYVFSMQDDERYSESGRAFNILITLTNQKTGNVTTFDTSKGDY